MSKELLGKYKKIRKGIFACNPMHVGRDDKLPVALYNEAKRTIRIPDKGTAGVLNKDKVQVVWRDGSTMEVLK